MSFLLQMSRRFHAEMIAHARAELPDECCGLLAGPIVPQEAGVPPVGRVTDRYPLVNAAASPVRYDADPKSLFLAFRDMRQRGLELLAIYHSHPTSDPVPSRTDLARNFYGPEVVHLIVSLSAEPPSIRAWRLEGDTFTEAEVVLSEP
jgi:proteasome lid subunit RPN8/RPN11